MSQRDQRVRYYRLTPDEGEMNTLQDGRQHQLRLHHGAGVPHYWLVDPRDSTLTVLRWNEDGYVTRVRAERDEIVRPEPFEAVELRVGVLFGDDPSV